MPKIVITPITNSLNIPWKEIIAHRELLSILAWRDFKVRYAQTFLGLAWAFINPVISLLVLTFVFGTIAKVDTEGIPHPLYTLVGLCGWTYFANLATSSGNSIIAAQNILKKVYFPRLIIPISKALIGLIDFLITLFCLIILLIIYQYAPGKHLLYFPLFAIMAIISGLAVGVWVSALTIRFRDFQHVVPMLLRLGMFVTPIAYSSNAVPKEYQLFYYMNPMAGVVEGMKWSILGGASPSIYIGLSFIVVLLLLLVGLVYFNKIEKTIADIL